jgi:hypothetical protein
MEIPSTTQQTYPSHRTSGQTNYARVHSEYFWNRTYLSEIISLGVLETTKLIEEIVKLSGTL